MQSITNLQIIIQLILLTIGILTNSISTSTSKPIIILSEQPIKNNVDVQHFLSHKQINISISNISQNMIVGQIFNNDLDNCKLYPLRKYIDFQQGKKIDFNYSIIDVDSDQDENYYILGKNANKYILLVYKYNSKGQYLLNVSQNLLHILYVKNTKNLLFYSTTKIYSLNIQNLINFSLNNLNFILGYQIGIKFMTYNQKYMFILTDNNFLNIYLYKNQNQLKFIGFKILTQFGQQYLEIVDVTVMGDILWVLDYQFGIYQFTIKNNQIYQIADYGIQHGKKLSIWQTFNQNILMVLIQIKKVTYIIQLWINKQKILINRFYTQVKDPSSIVFINQQYMLIIGKKNMMITKYGIQPQIYTNRISIESTNTKYSYVPYRKIKALKKDNRTLLLGYNLNTFNILQVITQNSYINCKVKSLPSFSSINTLLKIQYLQTTISNLSEYSKKIVQLSINMLFINDTYEYHQFIQTITQYSIIILITFIIILIIIAICRIKKKRALQKLEKSLDRHMQGIQLGARKKSIIQEKD